MPHSRWIESSASIISKCQFSPFRLSDRIRGGQSYNGISVDSGLGLWHRAEDHLHM